MNKNYLKFACMNHYTGKNILKKKQQTKEKQQTQSILKDEQLANSYIGTNGLYHR